MYKSVNEIEISTGKVSNSKADPPLDRFIFVSSTSTDKHWYKVKTPIYLSRLDLEAATAKLKPGDTLPYLNKKTNRHRKISSPQIFRQKLRPRFSFEKSVIKRAKNILKGLVNLKGLI